jgi:hypothetical protein
MKNLVYAKCGTTTTCTLKIDPGEFGNARTTEVLRSGFASTVEDNGDIESWDGLIYEK